MSTFFKCLLIVAVFSCVFSSFPRLNVGTPKDPESFIGKVDHYKLLDPLMTQKTKVLFKAWHFVFNKEYDYNTQEGIRRYKIFKANLKYINEHNASKSSFTMGLNHLADMTDEEVKEYYNLQPFNEQEVANNLRSLGAVSLDDLNEDGGENLTKRPQVDHRSKMLPVRNQKNCGSCWAFATQALLEGCFQLWQGSLQGHLSTQQTVDCDTGNGGCNGGFYVNALKYFIKYSPVYDQAYPYTAKKGTCRYSPGMQGDTKIKITAFKSYYKGRTDDNVYDELLKKGPVAIGVDANSDWFKYRSGLFDKTCNSGSNHAVVVVGYKCTGGNKCDQGNCYYIVRNSWGSGWGDAGHILIKDKGTKASSCNVEKLAFQPTSFTN